MQNSIFIGGVGVSNSNLFHIIHILIRNGGDLFDFVACNFYFTVVPNNETKINLTEDSISGLPVSMY